MCSVGMVISHPEYGAVLVTNYISGVNTVVYRVVNADGSIEDEKEVSVLTWKYRPVKGILKQVTTFQFND